MICAAQKVLAALAKHKTIGLTKGRAFQRSFVHWAASKQKGNSLPGGVLKSFGYRFCQLGSADVILSSAEPFSGCQRAQRIVAVRL